MTESNTAALTFALYSRLSRVALVHAEDELARREQGTGLQLMRYIMTYQPCVEQGGQI